MDTRRPWQIKDEITISSYKKTFCENSSVGRARPCQGRGRGFESRFSLNKKKFNETSEFRYFFLPDFAQMVKLVDTLVSGTSGRKAVQVRVLFWALFFSLQFMVCSLQIKLLTFCNAQVVKLVYTLL